MTDACRPCDREPDVLELCLADSWPTRADDDLREHVAACPSCRELVMVVSALAESGPSPEAPLLPDPALVWHRAQMRARRDASARAERPLVLMQVIAGAVVCVMLALWAASVGDVALGLATDGIASTAEIFRRWFSPAVGDTNDVGSADWMAPGLLAAGVVGTCLALAGLAVALSHLADRADEASDIPRG